MKAALLATFLAFALALHAQGAFHPSDHALRGSAQLHPDERVRVGHFVQNRTSKETLSNMTHTGQALNLTGAQAFPSYAACYINPNACTVNTQKVAAELGTRVILFFGCSIDIYAVDYFCKAANAPVVGFTRTPGSTVFAGLENLAYCRIGGLVLAYSFNPGATGPPYFPECDKVLKRPCSSGILQRGQLIQQSVASVVATFGMPPTAIVVDSSLWDVANWWKQAGNPPEPFIAPPTRLTQWCLQDFPTLMHMVQLASPTSTVSFRTAPRVEFIAGYGHSMTNIDNLNACFRSTGGGLLSYHMVDYNSVAETILNQQGGLHSAYFDDAFHPGVILSVVYIDWVLQWAKGLPIGR